MPEPAARVVVLVGHPRAGSRTHAVARRIGHLLGTALDGPDGPPPVPGWVDLAELAPGLLSPPGNGGPADAALRAVGRAPLLVVASPTFRAAYSGLLKLFLDLLPRYGLAGTVAVPLTTAGIVAHRYLVDTTLRPVLHELGAHLPVAGISVLESELGRVDDVFAAWWGAHATTLRRCVQGGNGLVVGADRQEVTSC
jgi:FMN reductase